jgi:REP element-mobilizing transposase RayT
MGDIWHSRGYLPHWEAGEVPQSITFRLADSLPRKLLDQWREELRNLSSDKINLERRTRIEHALDRGHGTAYLSDPRIADIVERAFLCFDANRYRLHAWSIMPNHVHVVASPLNDWTLSRIAHSWKGFTASKANEILQRKGTFWAPEYYDRVIRDEQHYANALAYVAMNPVKAGLCERPEQWRFSSSWSGER